MDELDTLFAEMEQCLENMRISLESMGESIEHVPCEQ